MNNRIGPEFVLTAENPQAAALSYLNQLGFEVTEMTPERISIHGRGLNLLIVPGAPSAPVLLLPVPNPSATARTLLENGCHALENGGAAPGTCLKDPFGLVYSVTSPTY